MNKLNIVPQKQFETLDAFIKGQNNYYAHFLKDNPWGEIRRDRPHFRRFQDSHSGMEEEATRATCESRSSSTRLPYEILFETYKIMSQLVFASDEGVMTYSKPDEYLLS